MLAIVVSALVVPLPRVNVPASVAFTLASVFVAPWSTRVFTPVPVEPYWIFKLPEIGFVTETVVVSVLLLLASIINVPV